MIADFVQHYGYTAVALGTFVEGEAVLLAAGYAAHRGWLWLPGVVAVAALCGAAGDQLVFLLGRRHGAALLARMPVWRRQVPRIERLLARYPAGAIVSVRFLYGLRLAGPFAMGAVGVPIARFAMLNLAGALLWAVLGAALGWYFGATVEALAGDIRLIEEALLAGLIAIGLMWAAWRAWRAAAPGRGQSRLDDRL